MLAWVDHLNFNLKKLILNISVMQFVVFRNNSQDIFKTHYPYKYIRE